MLKRKFIQELKKYLIEKYNCHLIILYGSYVIGEFTGESDVDLICFSDKDCPENDTSILSGFQLDAWIYNSEKIKNIDQYMRALKGKVIYDERNQGKEFLNKIKHEYNKGPKKLNNQQKQFLKDWMKKMYKRSLKDDVEGNFRFHWMLVDSLEIYFNIKGIWYLGPKKALKWLELNDIEAYNILKNVYCKKIKLKSIKELLNLINQL